MRHHYSANKRYAKAAAKGQTLRQTDGIPANLSEVVCVLILPRCSPVMFTDIYPNSDISSASLGSSVSPLATRPAQARTPVGNSGRSQAAGWLSSRRGSEPSKVDCVAMLKDESEREVRDRCVTVILIIGTFEHAL